MSNLPRRTFLLGIPASVLAIESLSGGAWCADGASTPSPATSAVPLEYPSHAPDLVRSMVGASHANIEAVREMLRVRPELAKAAWDWGFGDWETALGAASHVGRHDIVDLLLSHGARPDLFTLAMMDHVDALRAAIAARPGIERTLGPHGITLMAHARNGGAARVEEFLAGLDGADAGQQSVPLEESQKFAYVGAYVFGAGELDVFHVTLQRNGVLAIRRGEYSPRNLLHSGDHSFYPTGSSSVRIHFRMTSNGEAESLTIHDGELVLTAKRS